MQAFGVAAQVDTNKDRLISLGEFMESAKSEKFSENEEWEVRWSRGGAASPQRSGRN